MNPRPAVLAGPIVRAASVNGVSIWLATSIAANLELRLAIANSSGGAGAARDGTVPGSTRHQMVWLASGLYVHLLSFQPKPGSPLPANCDIVYDVVVRHDGTDEDWFSIWTPDERSQLAMEDLSGPSFRLETAGAGFRVAAGSCRKLHSDGGGDALCQWWATRTRTTRPHALLLLGDQIYADDVASDLLRGFYGAGCMDSLTAGRQDLPRCISKDDAQRSIGKRRELLRRGAAKTETGPSAVASECENHLATWGEYLLMYLAVWNDRLMASVLGMAYEVRRPGGRSFVRESGLREAREGADTLGRMAWRRQVVAECRTYRQVLANVPTYMLADDHEATDDWNFDDEWMRNRVASGPSAASSKGFAKGQAIFPQVLPLAEAAVFFMQHWGNDPEADEVTSVIASIRPDQCLQDESVMAKVQETLCAGRRTRYTFRVPHPKVRLVVLDTRIGRPVEVNQDQTSARYRSLTSLVLRREGTDDEPTVVPSDRWRRKGRLVGPDGLRKLETLASEGSGPLILATSTPLLLPPMLERMQALGDEKTLDREGWMSNPDDLMDLVAVLTRVSAGETVAVVAGDVHFGAKASVEFANGWSQTVIDQYTTSGLKNRLMSIAASIDGWIGERSQHALYWPSTGILILAGEHLGVHDSAQFEAYVRRIIRERGLERTVGETMVFHARFDTLPGTQRRVCNEHNILWLEVDSRVKGSWFPQGLGH